MAYSGCVIDSELLVLFVAGRTDGRIIGKHKRLGTFTAADFDVLSGLIVDLGGVVWVTPNTLTETSNLLGQHREPERESLFESLRLLVMEGREVLVHSEDAAGHSSFTQLGLTDSALLRVISASRPLLTTDGELYAAALAEDPNCVLNFNHYRGVELDTR